MNFKENLTNYLKNNLFDYLDSNVSIDNKLDRIFYKFDLLITYEQWDIIKDIIDNVEITKYNEYILIAFLTTTLSCSEKLGISRKNFYNKIEEEFKNRNIKDYKKLLEGLE